MGGRIDVLEFDNANLIERNAELHTELKSWKEDIKEIGNRSTDAMNFTLGGLSSKTTSRLDSIFSDEILLGTFSETFWAEAVEIKLVIIF
jgi:hypothetical protein